jgi:hypothetical protein
MLVTHTLPSAMPTGPEKPAELVTVPAGIVVTDEPPAEAATRAFGNAKVLTPAVRAAPAPRARRRVQLDPSARPSGTGVGSVVSSVSIEVLSDICVAWTKRVNGTD